MKKVTFTLDAKTLQMMQEVHDQFGASNSEIVRRSVLLYWLKVQDIKSAVGAGAEPQIGGKAQDAP